MFSTFLNWIEWGSLFCAATLLGLSETYHPSFTIAVGLLAVCWVTRRFRIGRFTRFTPIDIPIVFFIISALISLWAAPDRLAGLVRLYLVLAAVSFYYSLVNADFKTLRIFSSFIVALAAFLGVFLTSQYDWVQSSTRFPFGKVAGVWLNRVIPNLGFSLLYWNATRNILAGLLSISLPMALVGLFFSAKKNKRMKIGEESVKQNLTPMNRWVAGLSLVTIIFGLIIIESRAPWLVFGVIFMFWLWWWLSGQIEKKVPLSRIIIFITGLVVGFGVAVIVVLSQPRLFSLLTEIIGPKSYLGRFEIYPQSWRLAQDTPITGGGLASFPALYSHYIWVIPHNAFLNEDTGNSAYHNLLVERGWFGVMSFIISLLIALGTAMRRLLQGKNEDKSFVIAGIIGLVFILLHGFIHTAMVATRVLSVVFVPTGLALSGLEPVRPTAFADRHPNQRPRSPAHGRRPWIYGSIVILLILIGMLSLNFRNSLISIWYANLGAVHMAKIELYNFPSGQWDDGSRVGLLSPAEALFTQALLYDQDNRTAHHRLGLIAMLRHDYSTALTHLEKAHQLDPLHRGIRKTLGYSYVWDGQPELALPLLVNIPEAGGEMKIYVWWWETQGRDDLAVRSEQMSLDLQSGVGQANP